MPAVVAKVFNYFAGLLSKYILSYLWSIMIDGYSEWKLKKERKKVDEENLKKYTDAVKGGTDEEISKAAENLLNGRKP